MTATTTSHRRSARMSFEQYKRSYSSSTPVRVAVLPSQFGMSSRPSIVRGTASAVVQGRVRSTPSSHSPQVQRRRRIAIVLLVSLAVLAVLLPAREAFGGRSLVSSERPSAENKIKSIVVKQGDSLWDIAKELEPNKDPRGVVDQLIKSRGTSQLYVGETINWAN